jgi:hypothetical protein
LNVPHDLFLFAWFLFLCCFTKIWEQKLKLLGTKNYL